MIFYNSKLAKMILWNRFATVMLFGMVFTIYGKWELSETNINHEYIHVAQWIEVTLACATLLSIVQIYFIFNPLWILFSLCAYYIIYAIFWCTAKLRGCSKRQSYHGIPFEMEAFAKEGEIGYINRRDIFAWVNYIRN